MKVYVVTDGDYSDYRILACFENEDAASQFVAIGQTSGRVEEYTLFDRVPARVDWWVIDTIHYEHLGVPHERVLTEWEYEEPAFAGREYGYSRFAGLYGVPGRRVYGRDRERVRKVFYDNWHRERAEAEGIA